MNSNNNKRGYDLSSTITTANKKQKKDESRNNNAKNSASTPTTNKRCAGCNLLLPKANAENNATGKCFIKQEWGKPEGVRRCKICFARNKPTKTCAGCSRSLHEGASILNFKNNARFYFTKKQWKKPDGERRCVDCHAKYQNMKNKNTEKCSFCGERKNKGLFVSLPNKRRVCVDCQPAAEQELEEELERQRQEAERELERQRQEAQAEEDRKALLESYGPQAKIKGTYQVPGSAWWGEAMMYPCDSKEERDFPKEEYNVPDIEFKTEIPSLESLVGIYDLVFIYNKSESFPHGYGMNRITKGTLELKLVKGNDDGEHGAKQILRGLVSLDKSVRVGIEKHEDDVEFEVKRNNGEDEVFLLKVTNDEYYWDGDEYNGQILVVANKHAVKYMPECIDQLNRKVKIDYTRSIQFKSVEEAEKLLDSYKNECSSGFSWLTRLIMERSGQKEELPHVSKMIKDYVFGENNKPPPVLIFEEGDLWLTFGWDFGSLYGDYSTGLVARPRNLDR